MRALSHRIVDDAVDYLRGVRERPVWQDMPEEVKAFFMAACRRRRRRCPMSTTKSPKT